MTIQLAGRRRQPSPINDFDTEVKELVAETVGRVGMIKYKEDWETQLISEIFKRLTYTEYHPQISEESPLALLIRSEVQYYKDLALDLNQLIESLKEDILERFFDKEHWDQDIIREYIANRTSFSPGEVPDDLMDIVEEMADGYPV